MRTISQLLLTFLLNACWQIALLAAVASLCAWLLRRTAARYRHFVWVTALVISFGLPLLTASQLLNRALFSSAAPPQTAAIPPVNGQVRPTQLNTVEISAPTNDSKSSVHINASLAAGVIAFYLLFLAYRGVKLFRAWRRTRAIRRSARPIEILEPIETIIRRCQTAIGVTRFRILCSAAVPVPITVGIRNPLVILPERLLREADTDVLTSAVGHELVHVWRRDYLFNLIYELIYLPLSFHPAAALVRRRINQTRELGCDELVAEKLLTAEVYARSLVQLAGSAVPWGRPATITVGITETDILEVRIMSLLRRPKLSVRRKRLLLIAASLLLAVPCVAATSFAFHFDIDPGKSLLGSPQEPSREAQERKEKEARERREIQDREIEELKAGIRKESNPEIRAKLEEKLHRILEERAREERERKGVAETLVTTSREGWAYTNQGNQKVRVLYAPEPEYTADARANKIKGTVLVSMTVSSDGLVKDVQVLRPLYPSLDESALVTARQYRFEPFANNDQEATKTLKVEFHFGNYSVSREELEARRREEQEVEARQKAALTRLARITMDQAIQIATSQTPGKVLECSLIGEHWDASGELAKDGQVLYHVVILSGDEANPVTTHVLVNAIDGQIVRAAKEERRRKEPGTRL
jgi:TonB family protein